MAGFAGDIPERFLGEDRHKGGTGLEAENKKGVRGMPETTACPFCSEQVGIDDVYCRHCGSDLKMVSALAGDDPEDGGEHAFAQAGEPPRQVNDEFSELDYQPKQKPGFLAPVLVILLVLLMVAAGIYFLGNNGAGPVADDEPLQVPEAEEDAEEPQTGDTGQEEAENGLEEDEEPDLEDEASGPENDGETEPPDYDQLEAVLQEWLEERVEDPDVILVHTDDLEDVDQFFEEYDLEADNVIVYDIESTDDQFTAVVFGLPFSEWSIKAIFEWRDTGWNFLREATID